MFFHSDFQSAGRFVNVLLVWKKILTFIMLPEQEINVFDGKTINYPDYDDT